jgi:hypothetical protein
MQENDQYTIFDLAGVCAVCVNDQEKAYGPENFGKW